MNLTVEHVCITLIVLVLLYQMFDYNQQMGIVEGLTCAGQGCQCMRACTYPRTPQDCNLCIKKYKLDDCTSDNDCPGTMKCTGDGCGF